MSKNATLLFLLISLSFVQRLSADQVVPIHNLKIVAFERATQNSPEETWKAIGGALNATYDVNMKEVHRALNLLPNEGATLAMNVSADENLYTVSAVDENGQNLLYCNDAQIGSIAAVMIMNQSTTATLQIVRTQDGSSQPYAQIIDPVRSGAVPMGAGCDAF